MKKRLKELGKLLRVGGAFRPYLRTHRMRLTIAILLSVLFAALRLLEPWPLQIAFDAAILGKSTRFLGVDPLALVGGSRELLLLLCAGTLLVTAILSGAVYYVQSVILAEVGQEIVRSLRMDVFHQLQRLSLAFHRRTGTGDLLLRLTGDMVLLREMILATLVTLTTQTLTLAAVVVLMLAVSWKLTLASIVLAPALSWLFHSFRGRMMQASRLQRRREGHLAASMEEVLLAIPMIQAYTAEAIEDERFRSVTKKSARAGLRAARLEAGMQRLVELLIAVGTCFVIWYGTREVLNGVLTPGVYLVFLAYLRSLQKPIRGLSKVAERSARASAAMERVLEILKAKREVRDKARARPAPSFEGRIEFRNVSFAYDDGTVALREISFLATPGERLALVGPSGAGKSTLFSLLLRFADPSEGRIRIDAHGISTYTLESLRRQIAYLPQDPFVLSVSVRENLLYGRPEASDDELWQALREVELEELVRRMPRGLDTIVAARGQSLSGGERQRLAIARAMLKNAPIVLLDEPTTSLDARTEATVLAALDRLCTGRTSITIAHRISTVRSADRVLVLDQGRIVETGSPSVLLAREGLFRLLADLQGFETQTVRSLGIPSTVSPATESAGTETPFVFTEPTTGARAESPAAPSAASPESRSHTTRAARVVMVGTLMVDPDVRGVEKLLEENGPKRFLRDFVGTLPWDGPLQILVIKQRLGQRAVLRVDGLDPVSRERAESWFVKLIRSSDGEKRRAALVRISEEARALGVQVPEPLAFLPRFRALVFEEAAGEPLFPATGALDGARCEGAFFAVGQSLAQLHQRLTPPERSGNRERELERIERARAVLLEHRPLLRERFDAALGNQTFDLATGPSLVALHGDFYPTQVLFDKERSALAFLDWDEACRGEAEQDVGNFVAHVDLEAARERLSTTAAESLIQLFLRGYDSVRAVDTERFAWYRRASLLRLAGLYSRPDFGALPPNDPTLAERLLASV